MHVYLDEDEHLCEIVAVPGGEWCEQLKTVACGGHVHGSGAAICWRGLVGVLAKVEARRGELVTVGGHHLEFRA